VFPDHPLPEETAFTTCGIGAVRCKWCIKITCCTAMLSPKYHSAPCTQVVLIDFGAEFTPGSTQTHTGMVSDGYAPIEQYLPSSRTPATDVYGLAATLYNFVNSKVPLSGLIVPTPAPPRFANKLLLIRQ